MFPITLFYLKKCCLYLGNAHFYNKLSPLQAPRTVSATCSMCRSYIITKYNKRRPAGACSPLLHHQILYKYSAQKLRIVCIVLLCTVYCVLCTVCCVLLCTVYCCVLCTVCCVLCTVCCVLLCTVNCVLCTAVYCVLRTAVYCVLCTVCCVLLCTVCCVQLCTVYCCVLCTVCCVL